MTDLIERLKHEAIDLHEWAHAGKGGEPAEITANLLDEAIAALTPVLPTEEGEFTSSADVLDDWFNSCNVQGVAEMETIEAEELTNEMRRIERRYMNPVLPDGAKR